MCRIADRLQTRISSSDYEKIFSVNEMIFWRDFFREEKDLFRVGMFLQQRAKKERKKSTKAM